VWLPIFRNNAFFVLEYYGTVALATLLGVVFGSGRSAEKFLDYELNAPRHPPEIPNAGE
jgi:hypothetical protein